MAKVFEWLGDYEYVILAVILICVIYLVMKLAKINVNVSRDGFGGKGSIGFLGISDSTTHGGYDPTDPAHSRQGFSNGAYEAPVWHATPSDPSELIMDRAYADSAHAQEYGGVNWSDYASSRQLATGAPGSSPVKFTMNTEGMRGYSRKSMESMNDVLSASMLGANRAIQ